MTQFTWNRGLGVPGPYNEADFTTTYTGPAIGQWTWNRGLGFPGPWNDSSFVTSPGTPGGDVVAVSSLVDGGIVGTVIEIDGFDVVAYGYGGIDGEVTSNFAYSRMDVDYARVEWNPPYVTRVEMQ